MTVLEIVHRCVLCLRPWVTFTSSREPDRVCPFCGWPALTDETHVDETRP